MKSMNLPVERLLATAVQQPENGTLGKNLIKRLTLLSVFVLSFILSQAQVVEQKAMMAAMSDPNEVARLESLISDLQPTVYISSSGIKSDDETTPVCVDLKATDVAGLYAENEIFGSVELITVKVRRSSDLGNLLDLSRMASFTGLKYIRIVCEIECTAAQLNAMVNTGGSGVKVFYMISIPS